jgi:hypothetical protein
MADLRLVPHDDQTEVEWWLALANRVLGREITPEDARLALVKSRDPGGATKVQAMQRT